MSQKNEIQEPAVASYEAAELTIAQAFTVTLPSMNFP